MNVTRISQLTGGTNTLDINVTQQQLDRFENRLERGEYVQTIFPDLPAGEREFILSGITPEEWESAFGGENEDDEETGPVIKVYYEIDPDDRGGTGHGDISHSDADPGL